MYPHREDFIETIADYIDFSENGFKAKYDADVVRLKEIEVRKEE